MVRGIVFSHSWEVVMRSLCQPTLCLLVVCDWAQSVCIDYVSEYFVFLGMKELSNWCFICYIVLLVWIGFCMCWSPGCFPCVSCLFAYHHCWGFWIVLGDDYLFIIFLYFFTSHSWVGCVLHTLLDSFSIFKMKISLAWELMPYVLTSLCWAMCSVWTFSVL